MARSCAARDANNKDNVCKPNIPAGIKCPPPSKRISPITWFGAISTTTMSLYCMLCRLNTPVNENDEIEAVVGGTVIKACNAT